jgi:LPS export ABC transporter permease LptG
MKIFFRYLIGRLFVPFAVCVAACALIWIMVDLYGNIDDFLEHKTGILTILRFYALQLPSMLVQVLPAAMLAATLWTLLSLNRRSELVAFQSGGMAPIWLFSPFFVFAFIWIAILMFDLNWPTPRANLTRDRLLAQVKGQVAKYNVFVNQPYVDRANNRIWFFQQLDLNQNTGKGVEILQRDDNHRDLVKYFGNTAKWTGEFWRLKGVLVIDYNIDGGLKDQKVLEQLDLPDITTPPSVIGLVKADPEELTVRQLSEYIATSTNSQDSLAKYRTEWWYRFIYPFSLLVLMFYGLLLGSQTDRRTAMAGVFWVIVVLLAFIMVENIFLAAGRFNRLPPFIAVIATQVIFGGVGLYLLAVKYGWHWQLMELFRRIKSDWADRDEPPAAQP